MGRVWLISLIFLSLNIQGQGESFLEKHDAEIKAAIALWRSASFYPGAGSFSVFAEVIAVKAREGQDMLIHFRTSPHWTVVNEQGEDSRTDIRPARDLEWVWPKDAGPVPLTVGMKVELRVTADGDIRRVSYTFDEIRARHRLSDGRWELIVMIAEVKEIGQKGNFLRLLPRAFNPVGSEVRWTQPHGLLIGSFADSAYGGGDADETETAAMRQLGWPIANQSGTRILPGRDGWQRWNSAQFFPFESGANLRWLEAETRPTQWLLEEEDLARARKMPAESREGARVGN